MKYTVFHTDYGYSGIVYWLRNGDAIVVQLLLPRPTEKVVKQVISSRFPEVQLSSGDEVSELRNRFQDFFLGNPDPFPLSFVDMSICTPFQQSVLREEHAIPRGMTSSYGRIAKRLNSRAVRAVGSALARNPFPIVVPCHRAVRSNRTLGGYQGGLDMKRRILSMEGVKFDSRGRVHPDCFLGTP